MISTLLVMTLLILVTLATISLTTLETRTSKNSLAQANARANARLALQIAISQLQLYTGRDLATTSHASLLDTRPTPGSDPDPTILNPHLTLAYQTSRVAPETLENGIHIREINHLPAVLISGNENFNLLDSPTTKYPEGYITPRSAIDPSDSVKLHSAPTHPIRAPLVTLAKNSGSYAYCIADEGTKAKINLTDPLRPANTNLTSDTINPRENFLSLLAPPRLGIENSGNPDQNSEHFLKPLADQPANNSKILTRHTTTLAADPAKPSATQTHSHDFTTHSRSVLSDSQSGGLKKNLTAAANLPDIRFQELITHTGPEAGHPSPVFLHQRYSFPPETNTLSYHHYPGIPWEAFRSHIRRPEWETGITGPRPTLPALFANSNIPNYWEQTGKRGDNLAFRLARRAPILTRFQIGIDYTVAYNGIITEEDGSKWHDYTLRQHFLPLVSYWNPYNVPIRLTVAQRFAFYTNRDSGTGKHNTAFTAHPVSSDPIKIFGLVDDEKTGKSTGTPPTWIGPVSTPQPFLYPIHPDGNNTSIYNLSNISFSVPTFTIQPGESLLFAFNGRNKPYPANRRITLDPIKDANNYPGYSTYTQHGKIRVKHTSQNDTAGADLVPELHIDRYPSHADNGKTRVQASNSATFQRTNWDVGRVVSAAGIRFTPTILNDLTAPIPQSDANGTESPKFAATLIRKFPDISHYFPPDTTAWEAYENGVDTNRYLAPWFTHYNLVASRHGAYGAAPGSYKAFATPPLYIAGTIIGKDSLDLITPEMSPTAQPYTGYNDTASGGSQSTVIYHIPRAETPILSIGHLRHLNTAKWVSNYNTAPDFASATDAVQTATPIGNSFASPHIPIHKTHTFIKDNTSYAGTDGNASQYDTSYRYNNALWDRFFLTGNRPGEITSPADLITKIPNQSLKPTPGATLENFDNPHKSAAHLMLDGGFNINSTSIEAWKTILSATIGLKTSSTDTRNPNLTPFPRLTYTDASPITTPPADPTEKSLYNGSTYRALTPAEITSLAHEIVKQNKLRGPAPTLSQWINRTLHPSHLYPAKHLARTPTRDQVSYEGNLQAAINNTSINGAFNTSNAQYPGKNPNDKFTLAVSSPENTNDYQKGFINPKTLKYHSGYGNPATLTQADILARIGHLLTARSDTFTIRAYGDSRDKNGNILARAFCQAIVQRTPQWINPADAPETPPRKWTPDTSTPLPTRGRWTPNPQLSKPSRKFGRRYTITHFQWLSPEEI